MINIKQFGFSLVESMIGLALIAGTGLIIMRQQDTASKMQSKANLSLEINSISASIQKAVSNRAVCSKSFEGIKANEAVPEISDYVINPDFPHNSQEEFKLNSGNAHFKINQEFPGGVRLESMELVEVGPKSYLEVEFLLDPTGRKKFFGGDTTKKRFLIEGEKDAEGKFITCQSESTNLMDSSVQKACLEMGASWDDEADPKCRFTNFPECIVTNSSCRGGFELEEKWHVKMNNTVCTEVTLCALTGEFTRSCQCHTDDCRCTPEPVVCPAMERKTTCEKYAPANYCCLKNRPVPVTQPAPGGGGGGGGGGGYIEGGPEDGPREATDHIMHQE